MLAPGRLLRRNWRRKADPVIRRPASRVRLLAKVVIPIRRMLQLPSAPTESVAREGPRLALALLLASTVLCCSPLPAVPPPVAIPDAFSASGEVPPADRWWEDLDDPALDALIVAALADNLDLRTVWDRLAQAEAVARREGAGLIPSVNAEASTTRTELTQSAQRGSGQGGRNDFRLGLTASYEVDLWGRVRSTRDAARLDARATEYEVHAAAMTLSAEIAQAWYELVEQRRQLDILDDQIETNERVLELITLRFRKGQVPASDVLRQRQLVQSTLGARLPVEARAQVLEHQLAVLVGRAPRSVNLPPDRTIGALPPLPRTGLPAEVIEARPDVRQAYANLLAADRRHAAARADRYPRLALSGSAALAAEDLRDLVDNWIATFTANLVAPVIDGGRRAAEVDRTEALVSQRLHEYGQTILVSLREVEDALVQEQTQHRLIENLDAQLETSDAVLERIRDQYVHGTIQYLDVLQALLTHQELQRTQAAAQRELFAFRVDLHRAVGGGWSLSRPELASIDDEEGSDER